MKLAAKRRGEGEAGKLSENQDNGTSWGKSEEMYAV